MNMQATPRNRRMQDQLGMMLGMQQLDSGDMAMMSQMAELMMAPQKQQLLQQQVETAPEMNEAKLRALGLGGIGELASGLSYINPQLTSDVVQQMLTQGGYYQPDPDAELRRKAQSMGMTLEQLKQMIATMNAKRQ